MIGLPSSRAYVIRVLADPRNHRRSGIPATDRELRWVRDLNALGARSAEIDRDGAQKAPDTYAGTSVHGLFPRPAHLTARFTDDAARHRRALVRRLGTQVRVRRVRYSLSQLRSARAKIDFAWLDAQRIRPVSAAVSVLLNRVRLAVITPRRDAQDLIRRRHGPTVALDVTARDDERPACLPGDHYTASENGRELIVHYWAPVGHRLPRARVTEGRPGVMVALDARVLNGATIPACEFHSVRIILAEPLGGRRPIDAETGRALPRGHGSPVHSCAERYYPR